MERKVQRVGCILARTSPRGGRRGVRETSVDERAERDIGRFGGRSRRPHASPRLLRGPLRRTRPEQGRGRRRRRHRPAPRRVPSRQAGRAGLPRGRLPPSRRPWGPRRRTSREALPARRRRGAGRAAERHYDLLASLLLRATRDGGPESPQEVLERVGHDSGSRSGWRRSRRGARRPGRRSPRRWQGVVRVLSRYGFAARAEGDGGIRACACPFEELGLPRSGAHLRPRPRDLAGHARRLRSGRHPSGRHHPGRRRRGLRRHGPGRGPLQLRPGSSAKR